MNMGQVGLGVVGPGIIWNQVHKPVIKKFSWFFDVKAFCASSLRSKEAVLNEFPSATFHTDYKELLDNPAIDTVLIMTPIPLNNRFAAEALAANKDVFVEKPIATNLDEATSLAESHKRSKRRLFVLEQVAYSGLWKIVEEAIANGVVGTPLLFEKYSHTKLDLVDDLTRGYGKTEWRQVPQYPMGHLFDAGIHDIAIISRLFGKPEAVCASGANYREEFGEYDTVCSIFEFGRLRGFLSHSAYLWKKNNECVIRGTNGIISVKDQVFRSETTEGKVETISFAHENIHEEMWKQLVDCIRNNTEPAYTTTRALRDIEILEAINSSIKTGKKSNLS